MRARQGYGICLAHLGRHRESLEQFRLLLKIDPDDHVGARFLLGDLYHFLDDTKKAEKCYEKYGSFDAPFTHSLLLHVLGKSSDARRMLKKAFIKAPMARSMLADYLHCFVTWEMLESYKWGTFPPLRLHHNALTTAWNGSVSQIRDYGTRAQVEAAYSFCRLCGPLWLKYEDSYTFLKEGHPVG
jgi:tetratricopeptide (TPR) repeat protein